MRIVYISYKKRKKGEVIWMNVRRKLAVFRFYDMNKKIIIANEEKFHKR